MFLCPFFCLGGVLCLSLSLLWLFRSCWWVGGPFGSGSVRCLVVSFLPLVLWPCLVWSRGSGLGCPRLLSGGAWVRGWSFFWPFRLLSGGLLRLGLLLCALRVRLSRGVLVLPGLVLGPGLVLPLPRPLSLPVGLGFLLLLLVLPFLLLLPRLLLLFVFCPLGLFVVVVAWFRPVRRFCGLRVPVAVLLSLRRGGSSWGACPPFSALK